MQRLKKQSSREMLLEHLPAGGTPGASFPFVPMENPQNGNNDIASFL